MKSRPKKPSNPHPSSCTRPVKWPKIRPVIERDSISCTLFVFSGSDIRSVNMKKKLSKYGDDGA